MESDPLLFPKYLIEARYSLLHSPPDEQGGVVQRSSRPQQVCPECRFTDCLSREGAESTLSIDRLPQFRQEMS